MPRIGDAVDVTKTPQYGDKKKLQEMSSGVKEVGGLTVERGATGRPEEGAAPPASPEAAPQAQPAIPDEHRTLIDKTVHAEYVAQIARTMADMPIAGPWARIMADAMEARAFEMGLQLYSGTPFFPEEAVTGA
jgi:hypothetical protein